MLKQELGLGDYDIFMLMFIEYLHIITISTSCLHTHNY